MTTTASFLDPEAETRAISIELEVDADFLSATLLARATANRAQPINYEPWHELQTWLAGNVRPVTIPYLPRLMELIPPVAIRVLRDSEKLISLIEAHALLHQLSRESEGDAIVASEADYRAVFDLYAPLMAANADATVSEEVRGTVEAVNRVLEREGDSTVSQVLLVPELNLSASSVSRRVAEAIGLGYLIDRNQRGSAYPSELALGRPLPTDLQLLPSPSVLFDVDRDRDETRGHAA